MTVRRERWRGETAQLLGTSNPRHGMTVEPTAPSPREDALARYGRQLDQRREREQRRAANAPLPGVWHVDPDAPLAARAQARRDAERAAAARGWLRENGPAPSAYELRTAVDPYRGLGAAYDAEQEDAHWSARRAAIRVEEEDV
jgi:hypothetical protein